MELTFKVVTLGLQPHRNSQIIRDQLPKLFTGDPTGVGTIIDRILSNQPVVLAKNIPHENAENLLRILTDIGLKCRMEPMQLTLAPIEKENVSVYECPACGSKQPAAKNGICNRCGVVIEKYQDYHELKAARELERQRSQTVTRLAKESWNLGSIFKNLAIVGLISGGIGGIWYWQNPKISSLTSESETTHAAVSAPTPVAKTEAPSVQPYSVPPSPHAAPSVTVTVPTPPPAPKPIDPRSILSSATDLKPITPVPSAPLTQSAPPVVPTPTPPPAAVIPPPPITVTPPNPPPQTSSISSPSAPVTRTATTALASASTDTSIQAASRNSTVSHSAATTTASNTPANTPKSTTRSKNQATTGKSEPVTAKSSTSEPTNIATPPTPSSISDPNLLSDLARYQAEMGDVGAARQALNQLNNYFENHTQDFSSERLDAFNSTRVETIAVIANQQYKQKDISAAQESWLQAINLTNSLKASNERALAFSSLGRSLHSSNTATARNYFKRAEETVLLIDDPALRVTTLSTLARDLALTGRADQSRELFARVQTATAQLPNSLVRLIAMSVTAQHLAEAGDTAAAKNLLEVIARTNIASPPITLIEHRLQAQGAIAYHLARSGDAVTARTQFLTALDAAAPLQPLAARDKVLLYIAQKLGRTGDTKLAEHIVTQVLKGDTTISYSLSQDVTN